MGEVFDVTSGRSFYSEGSAYSVFAGRDGSVPFITGVFTEEETKKSTEVLSASQLSALDSWRKFYADSDKYKFVGLLEGRFYDKDGNPTEETKSAREKIANYVPPERKKKPQTMES